ncbi:MAG: hypothetical protein JJU11_14355 [Candidatus Sumerlaeia bacterium]|nr:hypothetical protein [Candidatus Sumerlaeia bacterium]
MGEENGNRQQLSGLQGLGLLVGPCWEYITRDELTAWCWRKFRVFTWLAFGATIFLILSEYVQTLFLNQLLKQGVYGPIFLVSCFMCIFLIYYFLYLIGAVFFYPLRMYKKTFLENQDLQFAPLRFRDRYAMIFAPLVFAYIILTAPGIFSLLAPSHYIAHFFMPEALGEFSQYPVSILDYFSSLLMGTVATILTFVTFFTIAQETIRHPHIKKSEHFRHLLVMAYPLVPWILHAIAASTFALGRTFRTFQDTTMAIVYLIIYTIFFIIMLRWAATIYFASLARVRRDCFQPSE